MCFGGWSMGNHLSKYQMVTKNLPCKKKKKFIKIYYLSKMCLYKWRLIPKVVYKTWLYFFVHNVD